MIGLLWGRFNPPHKGHMLLIKMMLKEADSLVIVLGSAQYKDVKRNPFSSTERAAMLRAYLREKKIPLRRIRIVALADEGEHPAMMRSLRRAVPRFDVLYTERPRELARLLGCETKRIRRFGTFSSTRIRNAIASGKRWEQFTGRSVATLIKRYDGVRRIKKTYDR